MKVGRNLTAYEVQWDIRYGSLHFKLKFMKHIAIHINRKLLKSKNEIFGTIKLLINNLLFILLLFFLRFYGI